MHIAVQTLLYVYVARSQLMSYVQYSYELLVQKFHGKASENQTGTIKIDEKVLEQELLG